MHAVYPSIIDTIFEIQNLTGPMFTLALSRDESNDSYGGVIAIGGVPSFTNPTINASSSFVSTPIEILITQCIDPGTPEYQFYTINIQISSMVIITPSPSLAQNSLSTSARRFFTSILRKRSTITPSSTSPLAATMRQVSSS
jgi:hypothetical protein